MSLIKDIDSWAKRTVWNTLIFSISLVLVACVLLIALPRIIDPKSQRYRDVMETPMYSTDTNVSQQLAQQLKDTRLRLMFRTHAHLADRLGIPQSDIMLVRVVDKTWKDTSLECMNPSLSGVYPLTQDPQPINVKGWKIIYKVGTLHYEYNTSYKGDWILCSKNEIPKDIAVYRSPLNR